MQFSDFSSVCARLQGIPGRLEKVELLSGVIAGLSEDDLPVFIRMILGQPFPEWSQMKLGIGPNLLYEAVAYVTGKKRESVIDLLNRVGDIGAAVETLLSQKSQTSFFSAELTLQEVYDGFVEIEGMGGSRSQKDKIRVIQRLLSNATPQEGHYITNILLEDMRIGVAEGNVRDAIAKAFGRDVALVEYAQQILNDMGDVAVRSMQGEESLRSVRMEPFRPVRMMLAKQGSISGVLAECGKVAVEYKYDGTRFQFHKKNGICRIYSRRLEDVTDALPDVIAMLDSVVDHDVILDGEVIAVQDGRPLPFQNVLRRFRRKHGVAGMTETIRLEPNLFDLLWLDGEMLITRPFSERRAILVSSVREFVTPQLVSEIEDEIETYYHDALDAGHEGVMLKVLSSQYTPGVRGKDWVKIKPEVDTLDLVVIGAEWGEGKRAKVFGSFLLGAGNGDDFIPLSRVATGFSDEDLLLLYETLKDEVIRTEGKMVFFEPRLVVEVGYSEIQKSPNYEGGYALRFPRFIRIRDDKDMREVNSVRDVTERYEGMHQ